MVTIATLGSHCALQVLKGAKDEGFKTLLLCEKKRERLYRRFKFIDKLILVDTFLELVERVSGHESTHARQIVETRNYIKAFSARERAINFVTLGTQSPIELGLGTIGLLKHADYVAGSAETLEKVNSYVGGVPLTIYEHNIQEIFSRLERDTKSGLWMVVCTLGDPVVFDIDFRFEGTNEWYEQVARSRP